MNKEEICRLRANEYLDPRTRYLHEIVKKRDGYSCQNPSCPDPTRADIQKNAHHLRYPSTDPWTPLWETPSEWLITPCEECHSSAHGGQESQPNFFKTLAMPEWVAHVQEQFNIAVSHVRECEWWSHKYEWCLAEECEEADRLSQLEQLEWMKRYWIENALTWLSFYKIKREKERGIQ